MAEAWNAHVAHMVQQPHEQPQEQPRAPPKLKRADQLQEFGSKFAAQLRQQQSLAVSAAAAQALGMQADLSSQQQQGSKRRMLAQSTLQPAKKAKPGAAAGAGAAARAGAEATGGKGGKDVPSTPCQQT